jgi:hypothetical protein
MKNDVERFWNKKKEKLKLKFVNISEKDLCFSAGKEKRMIEMLGRKLGKSEQELLHIIISL